MDGERNGSFIWVFLIIVVLIAAISYGTWYAMNTAIEPEITLPDESQYDRNDVPAATSTDEATTTEPAAPLIQAKG